MDEPFLRSFQLTGLKAAEREEAEATRRAERQARYLATTPHILTEAAVAEAERQRTRRPVDLMTGVEGEDSGRGRGQEPPGYFSIYDIDGNLVATVDPGGVRNRFSMLDNVMLRDQTFLPKKVAGKNKTDRQSCDMTAMTGVKAKT